MSKFFTFLLLFCALLHQVSAQSISITGDGSQPAAGAMVDIKSISKGLLIPRIALTGINDVATLPDRPLSLLIYNTATVAGANAIAPGYYYWDGTSWSRLMNTGSSLLSGWSLGGNGATSPATHFLGTTDNNALLFKVNNQQAGLVSPNGNSLWGYQSGYSNTGNSNVAIGAKALYSNTAVSNLIAIGDSALFSNSTGVKNLAVGSKALFTNASGFENTAIGFRSLYSNTSGRSNTATGLNALTSNTIGRNNVSMGFHGLYWNTAGDYNTAVGTNSLEFNSTGNSNTAVGAGALYYNQSGSNNTAIGANATVSAGAYENATAIGADAWVNCSNCLVLGFNSNVGIGVSNPGFPLNFSNALGGKISLHGTSGSHYGIGIQPALLQIHTDGSVSDVAIGYGSSSAFTENFRVKGNGNLLLGIANANATLTFGQSLTKKIVFYQGTVGQVGMGVFPGELRLYGDYPGASITFGNDNTTTGFSENMRIFGNGDLHVRGVVVATSSFYTSDSRLKNHIEPIGAALEKITQLNGYHYTWTDPQQDQTLQSGVLAQEVQQLFPELVKADDKGFLSVNYVGLVPYLIQSVKEQQKKLDAMQQQIDELKKLVKDREY
jgi:hypothetical protein